MHDKVLKSEVKETKLVQFFFNSVKKQNKQGVCNKKRTSLIERKLMFEKKSTHNNNTDMK